MTVPSGDLLDMIEAAKSIGITRGSLYNIICAGRGPKTVRKMVRGVDRVYINTRIMKSWAKKNGYDWIEIYER